MGIKQSLNFVLLLSDRNLFTLQILSPYTYQIVFIIKTIIPFDVITIIYILYLNIYKNNKINYH